MQESKILGTGVPLYAFTNGHQHQFCLALYIRAGSLFESPEQNGITHLFEHMVFRNLKRKYGGEFYDLLQLHGLYFCGTTYREFLRFSIEGPVFGFAFAAEILQGVFEEIRINSREFSHEKGRIKAEIREKEERNTLEHFFLRNVWKETNNEKTVLGYCRVLDSVSLKKLNAYRSEILTADNCFVYVTGNVSEEDLALLRERLNGMAVAQGGTMRTNEVTLSVRIFRRDGKVLVKNGDWYAMQFGFDVDTGRFDGGVLDVLYAVLLSGENAVLHNYLSENDPLIYSYDSTFEQYNNVANLYFRFEIEEEDMEEAVSRVIQALNSIKAGEFHFEANLRAQQANWLMMLDEPETLNWNMAYHNHILRDDPIAYHGDQVSRLQAVTKEAVMEAAREIFCKENLTLAVKGEKRRIDPKRLEAALEW